MKKLIACLVIISTFICLFGCNSSDKNDKKEEATRESVVDGYFTYIKQDDGTYSVTATDKNNFPEEVKIPTTYNGVAVTAIEDSAFSGCVGLRKITVPDSIVRLPYGAFYMCPDLEDVNLPSTISGIGQGAFGVCEKEIHIYFDGTTKQWGNISKAGNWASETKYYVHCSDGIAK